MRVMFIHQPYRFDMSWFVLPKVIPRNLLLLGSCLRRDGFEVSIHDMQIQNLSIESIPEALQSFNPTLVGLHIHSAPHLPAVAQCINAVKAYNADIKVVVGGIFPSFIKERVFEFIPQLDFLALNEGEETIVNLARMLETNGDLKDVQGIIYRDSLGNIHNNGVLPPLADLNSYPLPAYDLINLANYNLDGIQHPYVETQRGCSYNCKFCGVHYPNWGSTVRYRNPEKVVDEIEIFSEHQFKQFFITDDTFSLNRDHALSVCDEIRKRGLNNKIVWSAYTRVDRIDEELLQIMHDSGCRSLAIGVESGSQKALDSISKKASLEQYIKGIEMIKGAGIICHTLFIIGFPDVSHQDIQANARFLRETEPTITQFFMFHPTPGTEFFNEPQKYGLHYEIKELEDWYKFDFVEEPLCSTKYMEKNEIIKYYCLFNLAFKSLADSREDLQLQERLSQGGFPIRKRDVMFTWAGQYGLYWRPELPSNVIRMDLFRNCFRLNKIQYEILLRCNGDHTVDEISQVIAKLFDLNQENIPDLVHKTLKKFEELGLIDSLPDSLSKQSVQSQAVESGI
jgi:anaerobic magnesium-protoporphyrin IX monomethyl ester cyclase